MNGNEKPLDKLIDQLSGYIQSTGDFVLEQAPEILTQICEWDYIFSLIWGISMGILFLISMGITFIGIHSYKKRNKRSYDDGFGFAFLAIVSSLVSILCIILMINNICTAIQISKAPKYYIVKKIMSRDF